MEPVNLHEFEEIARNVLPKPAYDYYAGGADDEITLLENREAFRKRSIAYRVLVDVENRDLSTSLLGIELDHPILLAPTAMQKMAHPDGESATAQGAAEAGALHTVSTISTTPLEDVMKAAPENPKWFQLYCYGERELTEILIKRAVAAGYKAIVLTVDLPVLGNRERDLRNSFVLPEGLTFANFEGDAPRPQGSETGEQRETVLTSWASDLSTNRLTWDALAWIRERSGLPLILKGIVRADDALKACELGVDGIWVSNHGGRQLDGSIPTLDALEKIAREVKGRTTLIVDGGVRRGTDVLKALALGADAVAIGRPQLWGLAAGGADGVKRVINLLRQELSVAMALAGCPTLDDITSDLIS
ncbi:MAG: alpha-hydroxy acid oxidase [Actinomycetota bacterium]